MHPRGVLIAAKVDNEVCVKCSGIKVNEWIITHGTIVLPFINDGMSDLCLGFNSSQVTFEVLIQKDCNKKSKDKTNETESYNATLEGFYQHEQLTNIIKKSLSSVIYDRIETVNNEIAKSLSLFILLKIKDANSCSKQAKLESESFQLGMDILVESTPFAATPFFNSWSRGVVSKVLDPGNQLVLIDTRIAVGSEGAPIFSYYNGKQKNLLGMVICVLNQCQKEFVGLTLGCSVLPILQYFKAIKAIPTTVKVKTDLDTLKAAVVFIRSGNMWGSGVIINSAKGIVLTCSHIINETKSPVFVLHRLLKSKKLPAEIVYATPKNRPYDLAVLRIPFNCGLQQLNLSNSMPVKGEKVISAGYSLLSEYDPMGLGITVSQGTISHLEKNGPLHITSSIHAGASGGAIMQPPNQLVGIIMCNSKVGNCVLPEFSMGLSVKDFYQPLKRYLDTDDRDYLNELTIADKEVIVKWDLNFHSKL